MSVDKGSESAFPRRYWVGIHSDEDGDEDIFQDAPGMTLRQHYAGLAMQALLAGDNEVSAKDVKEYLGIPVESGYDYRAAWPAYVAKRATAYADALLAALESKP